MTKFALDDFWYSRDKAKEYFKLYFDYDDLDAEKESERLIKFIYGL